VIHSILTELFALHQRVLALCFFVYFLLQHDFSRYVKVYYCTTQNVLALQALVDSSILHLYILLQNLKKSSHIFSIIKQNKVGKW